MGVFLDKLEQRIANERLEIQRIRTDAVLNEDTATKRLVTLQAAADALKANARLEALLMQLGELGIKLEA